MSKTASLFFNVPTSLPEELVEVLAATKFVRIERIVSTGHKSPDGSWYDQQEHEFVVVLKGEARLLFEGDEFPKLMQPGDFLCIAAGQKHRVESTSADEPTIWLAVFYQT